MCVYANCHLCKRVYINLYVFSGVDDDTFSPGDDSVFDPASHVDERSNLVDSRPSVVIQEPTLLDLPRDPVDRALFESYTYTGTLFRKLHKHTFPLSFSVSQLLVIIFSLSVFTGISSPLLSFRPFSLRPGSRYMLEVTASKFNFC